METMALPMMDDIGGEISFRSLWKLRVMQNRTCKMGSCKAIIYLAKAFCWQFLAYPEEIFCHSCRFLERLVPVLNWLPRYVQKLPMYEARWAHSLVGWYAPMDL